MRDTTEWFQRLNEWFLPFLPPEFQRLTVPPGTNPGDTYECESCGKRFRLDALLAGCTCDQCGGWLERVEPASVRIARSEPIKVASAIASP